MAEAGRVTRKILQLRKRMQTRRERDGIKAPAKCLARNMRELYAEISPQYEYPEWLQPYIESLEHAITHGNVQQLVSAPPQHVKTTTTLHALVLAALLRPELRHVYATFNVTRSVQEVSPELRALLNRAGVVYSGTQSLIRFPQGGFIKLTSLDAAGQGFPIDGLCVVDDPYASDEKAQSAVYRRRVETGLRSTFLPRMHPGASLVVMHTRWHPEDLIGVLSERDEIPYINLPAIAEYDDPLGREPGEPLWPSQRPLDWLEKKRFGISEHHFVQLYQGHPRLVGGGKFKGVYYYRALPTRYMGAYGTDLAYTASTSADESVNVELWREENSEARDLPWFYVVNVEHARQEAPDFADVLVAAQKRRPSWRFRWRCSGTERGAAQFLKRRPYNVPLVISNVPGGGKTSAAQDIIIAWKQGRILLPDPEVFPEHAKWVKHTTQQMHDFTGTGAEHDDIVDALGNAHLELRSPPQNINILPAAPARMW